MSNCAMSFYHPAYPLLPCPRHRLLQIDMLPWHSDKLNTFDTIRGFVSLSVVYPIKSSPRIYCELTWRLSNYPGWWSQAGVKKRPREWNGWSQTLFVRGFLYSFWKQSPSMSTLSENSLPRASATVFFAQSFPRPRRELLGSMLLWRLVFSCGCKPSSDMNLVCWIFPSRAPLPSQSL